MLQELRRRRSALLLHLADELQIGMRRQRRQRGVGGALETSDEKFVEEGFVG